MRLLFAKKWNFYCCKVALQSSGFISPGIYMFLIYIILYGNMILPMLVVRIKQIVQGKRRHLKSWIKAGKRGCMVTSSDKLTNVNNRMRMETKVYIFWTPPNLSKSNYGYISEKQHKYIFESKNLTSLFIVCQLRIVLSMICFFVFMQTYISDNCQKLRRQ